eukprot:CAMPEP_0174892662 /NCGR_PEP_ID=MMETSP0167-20121228/7581_1 /TAXON_ID=38298 /ORGANISM="Rhodella maculata, Strain CCMP736" /LENGTH=62 /DNA_ID=CAMNT_0016131223 /DNA_START=33 /DNA_END=218 /DNA_ORIENTATION=-
MTITSAARRGQAQHHPALCPPTIINPVVMRGKPRRKPHLLHRAHKPTVHLRAVVPLLLPAIH